MMVRCVLRDFLELLAVLLSDLAFRLVTRSTAKLLIRFYVESLLYIRPVCIVLFILYGEADIHLFQAMRVHFT